MIMKDFTVRCFIRLKQALNDDYWLVKVKIVNKYQLSDAHSFSFLPSYEVLYLLSRLIQRIWLQI